jgi:hypothetical protein
MKIHNKYKKTIEKTQGENLPTLGQIQDFVRNLRRKLGDTNNIEDVKSYVEKHGYSPELSDTDLYYFGVEYGNGIDDEHFHVGFTSKKMLARAKGAEVFHVELIVY